MWSGTPKWCFRLPIRASTTPTILPGTCDRDATRDQSRSRTPVLGCRRKGPHRGLPGTDQPPRRPETGLKGTEGSRRPDSPPPALATGPRSVTCVLAPGTRLEGVFFLFFFFF